MFFRALLHKRSKGQAMVETAFVLFILVTIAFGITEFGRALYTKNTLNNAARAGVRAAVVTSPLNGLQRTYTNVAGDNIQQNIFGSLFYMNKALVTANVCVADNTGACTASTKAVSGDVVKVTVTYTGFKSVVPKLAKITGTLVGQASMRYE
jgi:Flp pilus assembly protein TadG